MQLNQVTCIQQLLESVGLTFHGPVTSSEIKNSQSGLITAITLTGSCAKSSAMVQIMGVNLKPSPDKPSSQSQSSETSSQSTLPRFLPIYAGMDGWTINSNELDILLHLLEGNGGSLDVGTILRHSGKPLLMTLREVSPTSSTEPCSESGDGRSNIAPKSGW